MAILEAMRHFWLDLQQGQVISLGLGSYLLLMVLIIIQGPISTMLGGAAAAAGLLNPVGVLAVAVVGNLGADALWYSVGRSSTRLWTRPTFRRYRALANVLQGEMQRHATRVLLLAKLSVGMAVPAVIAAGLARVPWRRWFPVVALGELLWTGALLLTGYFATEKLIASESTIVRLGTAVSAALFVGTMVYVLRRLRRPPDPV